MIVYIIIHRKMLKLSILYRESICCGCITVMCSVYTISTHPGTGTGEMVERVAGRPGAWSLTLPGYSGARTADTPAVCSHYLYTGQISIDR